MLRNGRRALLVEQVVPRVGIGRLGQSDLIVEGLAVHMREIEMAQSMAADLEIGIGNQLLGALFVGLHPFAASEEGSLHALGTEKVDDPPVVASDVAIGLAQ